MLCLWQRQLAQGSSNILHYIDLSSVRTVAEVGSVVPANGLNAVQNGEYGFLQQL